MYSWDSSERTKILIALLTLVKTFPETPSGRLHGAAPGVGEDGFSAFQSCPPLPHLWGHSQGSGLPAACHSQTQEAHSVVMTLTSGGRGQGSLLRTGPASSVHDCP